MKQLNPAEFAARLEDSSRRLWCIAIGILGHRQGVEDVLQDAAVIALEKLNEFDAETSFEAWMGKIVKFVALNQARKTVRRQTQPTDPATIDSNVHSNAQHDDHGRIITSKGTLRTDQDAFDDRVVAGLSELSEAARVCLLLRIVLDMPYKEISRILNIPEGTAMGLVHRGRAQLRTRLAPEKRAEAAREVDS